MRTTAQLGVVAALVLLATGCTQAVPDTHDADAKALRDNEVQWNLDVASKDADKWVAHYADDAVLMSPGMPPSVVSRLFTPVAAPSTQRLQVLSPIKSADPEHPRTDRGASHSASPCQRRNAIPPRAGVGATWGVQR